MYMYLCNLICIHFDLPVLKCQYYNLQLYTGLIHFIYYRYSTLFLCTYTSSKEKAAFAFSFFHFFKNQIEIDFYLFSIMEYKMTLTCYVLIMMADVFTKNPTLLLLMLKAVCKILICICQHSFSHTLVEIYVYIYIVLENLQLQ